MYNLTNLSNAGGLYDIVRFINNSTDGLLMLAILLAVFFIMLLGLKRFPFSQGLMVASLFGFVMALIASSIGLMSGYVMLIMLLLLAMALFIDHLTTQN